MKFTKMHGAGNDYVYVNCLEEKVDDPYTLARKVSDRHFGIGSDGLILIRPSECGDFMMDMYNVDGTRGLMCGNAIRCVGKYVYDNGMTDKKELAIESASGLRYLSLMTGEDGKVEKVRVDMRSPILEASKIPVICDKKEAINEPITVDGTEYRFTGVSMGNPHAVVVLDDVDSFPLSTLGPKFEVHEKFPDRANVEFITVLDPKTIRMRVWERGSGITLACGTGACASTVAAILGGLTEDEVTVKLDGGELLIKWDRDENIVYMTGPAVKVFEGEIDI